jgi:hypothetical protein
MLSVNSVTIITIINYIAYIFCFIIFSTLNIQYNDYGMPPAAGLVAISQLYLFVALWVLTGIRGSGRVTTLAAESRH